MFVVIVVFNNFYQYMIIKRLCHLLLFGWTKNGEQDILKLYFWSLVSLYNLPEPQKPSIMQAEFAFICRLPLPFLFPSGFRS